MLTPLALEIHDDLNQQWQHESIRSVCFADLPGADPLFQALNCMHERPWTLSFLQDHFLQMPCVNAAPMSPQNEASGGTQIGQRMRLPKIGLVFPNPQAHYFVSQNNHGGLGRWYRYPESTRFLCPACVDRA